MAKWFCKSRKIKNKTKMCLKITPAFEVILRNAGGKSETLDFYVMWTGNKMIITDNSLPVPYYIVYFKWGR